MNTVIGLWPLAKLTQMSVNCAGRPRMAHCISLALRPMPVISPSARRIAAM